MEKKTKQDALAPTDELAQIIREATRTVEDQLRLEDAGWISLSGTTGEAIPSTERILNLNLSRLYYNKDPLARQSIRLWTDYTFGTGMTWSVPPQKEGGGESKTQKVLEAFWNDPANAPVLSARGQRKSSDKLLVDGDIFFAIFLGAKGTAKIRTVDPLEITEIISDADDKEALRFFKREWTDAAGVSHDEIYRSTTNTKAEPGLSLNGPVKEHTQDALIYYLNNNTISQRGNPLLLPALDWIKQYRRFLASRVAVMLAYARFAWSSKVQGGPSVVDAIKGKTHQKEIAAGSTVVENMGVDTKPLKIESGASGAYQDAKMIKYQICAAVGIPEQYFGDISTGNLATAKTVELPMMKMFQSYQAIWRDAYKDVNEVVLTAAGVAPDNQYVDMDFPAIAPADVAQAATAIAQILAVIPELGGADEVKQVALMTLGINDPQEVLDAMDKVEGGNTEAKIISGLKQLREALTKKEK